MRHIYIESCNELTNCPETVSEMYSPAEVSNRRAL